MYIKLQKFNAMYAACELIKAYYVLIDTDPRVKSTCFYMYSIYALWTVVDFVLIGLRITSLVYMGKSYKFLQRKLKDKARRKLHIMEKKKKMKRITKRDLHKRILEKRSEQILFQQKINRQNAEEAARREF